ncbi:hypothetical protein V6N13_088157 [Hibiscus sabdariffa]
MHITSHEFRKRVLTWTRVEVYGSTSNEPATGGSIVDATITFFAAAAFPDRFQPTKHGYNQKDCKDQEKRDDRYDDYDDGVEGKDVGGAMHVVMGRPRWHCSGTTSVAAISIHEKKKKKSGMKGKEERGKRKEEGRALMVGMG